MRLARLRLISRTVLIVVVVLAIVWVLGPAVGVALPTPVFIAILVGGLLANFGLVFWSFRRMRADAANVLAAHEGAVAFGTAIIAWPAAVRAERERAIVLVADEGGLSFRDHEDREVLLVPADHILSLELAPLVPRARLRPFRVTTIDGMTVDFAGSPTVDGQVDQIVALRTALGRSAG